MRRRVASEFPADRRDSRFAFGVYKQLLRLPDPDQRWDLLGSRASWTETEMQNAVNVLIDAERAKVGKPSGLQTANGMRVGPYRIKGELIDGELRLDVDAPIATVESLVGSSRTTVSLNIES